MSEQNRDFGNDADMSVHEKAHPTLGPTDASQDVDSLPVQIVPMGAYNDPNNPVAVAGSVNLSLNDHPVAHADDYGKELREVYGHDHVENTMSDGAKSLKQFDTTEGASTSDREEWSKADWQKAAKHYGLAGSGNIATLRERVEAHEAESGVSDADDAAREEEVEAAKSLKAGEWQEHVAAAEDAEALAELRSLYDESGASYATVEKAFDERADEFKSDSNES